MSNPNKAKGSRWELELRRYLDAAGLAVVRPWQEGHEDTGDLWLEDEFVGQAKNYGDIATGLALGVAGARRQAQVARRAFGIAFVKRRGKGAAESYSVMETRDMARLLLYVEGLRDRVRTLEAQQAQ